MVNSASSGINQAQTALVRIKWRDHGQTEKYSKKTKLAARIETYMVDNCSPWLTSTQASLTTGLGNLIEQLASAGLLLCFDVTYFRWRSKLHLKEIEWQSTRPEEATVTDDEVAAPPSQPTPVK